MLAEPGFDFRGNYDILLVAVRVVPKTGVTKFWGQKGDLQRGFCRSVAGGFGR